ncbi:MAG: amidohydrolase/deacetylase family metallohydrolase [Bryobacteraceae bacterium]
MTKSILAVVTLASVLDAQTTYDLLLKGGRVIDPKNRIDALMDVAIADGKIARVAANLPASQARRTVNVQGLVVTPGLIDIHVHVYTRPELKSLERDSSVQPDAHAFRTGVTTVVDAGTSGAKTFADFKARVIDKAQTRVLALLNISAAGMGTGREDELSELDADLAARTAKANPGVIVGFKSAHFGGPGWESIEAAVKAGKEADIPVMVDFGYLNAIRNLSTLLLDKLRPGDIYTHCFSGHREELLENGKVNPAMFAARKRGIFFDVGFGAGSFYWYVAAPALQQGFAPDSISTDLHSGSMNAGMKTMANSMSSILNLGSPLAQVIAMSTWNPARQIKRTDLGHLDPGAEADVAVLRADKGEFGFVDSARAMNTGSRRIEVELTLRRGRVVWDLNGRASENWKTFKYDRKKWTK